MKPEISGTVTYDPNNDLALLKADFTPAELSSPDTPELLQDLVAGYPFGMGISSTVKVTTVTITAQLRSDRCGAAGYGGPIVDEAVNVIGVAVAKLDVRYAMLASGAIHPLLEVERRPQHFDSNTVDRLRQRCEPETDLDARFPAAPSLHPCWMTRADRYEESEAFDDLHATVLARTFGARQICARLTCTGQNPPCLRPADPHRRPEFHHRCPFSMDCPSPSTTILPQTHPDGVTRDQRDNGQRGQRLSGQPSWAAIGLPAQLRAAPVVAFHARWP